MANFLTIYFFNLKYLWVKSGIYFTIVILSTMVFANHNYKAIKIIYDNFPIHFGLYHLNSNSIYVTKTMLVITTVLYYFAREWKLK
jgi:hypothetical protein